MIGNATTATLLDTIRAIREDLATIPGSRMHFNVPDSINESPALVVYPSSGAWRLGSHSGERGVPMRMAKHTIQIVLFVARKDLERDFDQLMWFCDVLPDRLFAGFKADKYGDTVLALGDPKTANNATEPIRYVLGPEQWASDDFIVWGMELDVTTNQEINL